MNRDQKAAVIDEIAADITSSQAIFAVDYRGISVAQAEALRGRLREADASFRVVKNSLTERAADRAGAEHLKPLLEGPTALTFVQGDAAAAAKAVADFARLTQLLAFKGGVMDGAALTAADVGAISRLPSRDVLYGQLVGLVASPIAGLARTLNALVGGLAIALNEIRAKKEIASPPSAAEAMASAETVEASDSGAGAESPAAVEVAPDVVAPAEEEAVAEAFGGEGEPEAEEAFGAAEETSAAEAFGDAEAPAPEPAAMTELAPEAVSAGAEEVTADGSAPEAPATDDDEKEN